MQLSWRTAPSAAASGRCSVYAACMDCGAETAHASYKTPEERLEAAKKVAFQWNMGKVIHTGVGD